VAPERAALLAPAIAFARDGYPFEAGDLIPSTGSRTEGYAGVVSFFSQPNVSVIFLHGGGGILSLDDFARYTLRENSGRSTFSASSGLSTRTMWRNIEWWLSHLMPMITKLTTKRKYAVARS
jgi:hypothetical protein